MITETIAAAVKAYEADMIVRAWESVRAAVDQYELDCWELVRQQLETSPTYDH